MDELRLTDHARAIDVRAVVAGTVDDEPTRTVLLQGRVLAGDVALGQADRVVLAATDRVLVAEKRKGRSLSLVVFDRQLPHDATVLAPRGAGSIVPGGTFATSNK